MKTAHIIVSALVATSAIGAQAQSLARASEVSARSAQDVIAVGLQLSVNTVEIAKDGVRLSANGVSGLMEVTAPARQISAGAISRAGNFVVNSVSTVAQGSARIVSVTFENAVTGVKFVATFSFDQATAIGQASLAAAQGLLKIGSNLVVATASTGLVLVTDSATGAKMMASGEIAEGSQVMIASFGRAAKTFGSKALDGLELGPASEWPQTDSGN